MQDLSTKSGHSLLGRYWFINIISYFLVSVSSRQSRVSSPLASSRLFSSHLISSRLVPSRLVSSRLVASHHIASRRVASRLAWYCISDARMTSASAGLARWPGHRQPRLADSSARFGPLRRRRRPPRPPSRRREVIPNTS